MPKTATETNEDTNTVNKEMEKKLEKVFSNCQANEQGGKSSEAGKLLQTIYMVSFISDNNPSATPEQATLVEVPPECCDNPDCLCNLKQEPSEDTGYENPSDMPFM